MDLARARLHLQKWRWYERNSLPWNRLAIHREMARRGAFARWPIQGNVLEALREGRLEVGEGTLFEPQVWITAPGEARVRIGQGCFLNIGVMVAAHGAGGDRRPLHVRQRLLRDRRAHRFDDPDKPVTWQGFTTKGPTHDRDNVWCGANVVITSGVTVGERCVIGANSVVTQDLPARTICAGAPAKVLREIEYGSEKQETTRWNDRSAGSLFAALAVRTFTAFGLMRVGGTEIGRPPVPPVDSSPIVAAYVQLAMLRWKMTA